MNFGDAIQTIKDAEQTIQRAEYMAKNVAYLISGRLRASKIDSDTLIALKRELADFNIQTRRWKKK